MFNVLIYYSIKYTLTKKDIDQQSLDSLPEDKRKILQGIIDDNEILLNNMQGVLATKNKLLLISVANRHTQRINDALFGLSVSEVLPTDLFKIQFPSLLEISVKFARANVAKRTAARILTRDCNDLVKAEPESVYFKQIQLFKSQDSFKDFIKFIINADKTDDDIEKLKDANNRNILHLLTLYKAPFFMIKSVLKENHKLHIADNFGNTPLHYAAQSGSIEAIRQFVNDESVVIRTLNAENLTALYFAAESGNFEAFKFLYDRSDRADLDLIDNHGNSMIHYAAKGGNLGILKLLIGVLGENCVNRINNSFETPLYILLDRANELGVGHPLIRQYERAAEFLINNKKVNLNQESTTTYLSPIELIIGSSHKRLFKVQEKPVLSGLLTHPRVKAYYSLYDLFSGYIVAPFGAYILYNVFKNLPNLFSSKNFVKFAVYDSPNEILKVPICAAMQNSKVLSLMSEEERSYALSIKDDCEYPIHRTLTLFFIVLAAILSLYIPASCLMRTPANSNNDNDDDQEVAPSASVSGPRLG